MRRTPAVIATTPHFISTVTNCDQRAAENLAKKHVYLVITLALTEKYSDKGLTGKEIVDAGMNGLIEAARCFDSTEDFAFNNHALPFIDKNIQKAIGTKKATSN
jgi:DNA-directed RNA polymerase sigma subunit (sigma70/sigma32)